YTYLHSAIDGFSRLAYTEPLEDETAATTIGFLHRAFAFFAAHGITRITRLISDNGPNYRSNAFARSIRGKVSRHQRTRPYTPRHNGKVERFQRITVDEFLYAEVFESEQERRNRPGVWLHHSTSQRPHTACGDQPPASRLHASVDNVMTNYSEPLGPPVRFTSIAWSCGPAYARRSGGATSMSPRPPMGIYDRGNGESCRIFLLGPFLPSRACST